MVRSTTRICERVLERPLLARGQLVVADHHLGLGVAHELAELVDLPRAQVRARMGRRRCWMSAATASTVAVRKSSRISASPSSPSVPGGREAMMTPRSGVGSRGALRAVDT